LDNNKFYDISDKIVYVVTNMLQLNDLQGFSTALNSIDRNVLPLCFRKNIVYPSLKDTISFPFAVPAAIFWGNLFPVLILQI